MCIIILNKSKQLDAELLDLASANNPDGAGLMYAMNNKLHTYKNIDNDKVIDKYYKVRKKYKGIIALHFRIATDGSVDTSTCHPYVINKNTSLMHNGIITQYAGMNTKLSDTQLYINDNLSNLPEKLIFMPEIKNLIKLSIGVNNKFLIMNNKGEICIINEKAGHFNQDGDWFSNESYRPYKPAKFDFKYSKKAIKKAKNDSEYCDYCGNVLYGSELITGICSYCNGDMMYNCNFECKTCKNENCFL